MEYRWAQEADTALLLQFIQGLAEYEHLADEQVADAATLQYWIFEQKKAEVLFALEQDKEVGYTLFFHNFSTFLGRAGIYIEDLYILPEYRGKGYGKFLLKTIARIAVERGCGRMEWSCLNWNQSSIDIYLGIGAKPLPEWTIYRLTGEQLQQYAK